MKLVFTDSSVMKLALMNTRTTSTRNAKQSECRERRECRVRQTQHVRRDVMKVTRVTSLIKLDTLNNYEFSIVFKYAAFFYRSIKTL